MSIRQDQRSERRNSTEEYPYTCEQCEKTCWTRSDLHNHVCDGTGQYDDRFVDWGAVETYLFEEIRRDVDAGTAVYMTSAEFDCIDQHDVMPKTIGRALVMVAEGDYDVADIEVSIWSETSPMTFRIERTSTERFDKCDRCETVHHDVEERPHPNLWMYWSVCDSCQNEVSNA
jgi:hypothetical protein